MKLSAIVSPLLSPLVHSSHYQYSAAFRHHSLYTHPVDPSSPWRSRQSRKGQIEFQWSANPNARIFDTHLWPSDAAKAFRAIKSLGRDPSGSEFLALPENFLSLLSLSTSYEGDRDASLEALRCIANALLLVESSRETFLKSPVNGGDFCLNALEAWKFNCSFPCINDHLPRKQLHLIRSLYMLVSSFSLLLSLHPISRNLLIMVTMGTRLWRWSVPSSTCCYQSAFRPTPQVQSKRQWRMYSNSSTTWSITILRYICFCAAVMYLSVAQITQDHPPSRATVEDKNKALGDLWSPKLDGWGNDSFCPNAAHIHIFLSVTATSLLAFCQFYFDYLSPSHLLHQTPSRLHWLTFYMFLSGYPFLLLSKFSGFLHRRQIATRLAQFLRLPTMTSIRIVAKNLLCFRRLPADQTH